MEIIFKMNWSNKYCYVCMRLSACLCALRHIIDANDGKVPNIHFVYHSQKEKEKLKETIYFDLMRFKSISRPSMIFKRKWKRRKIRTCTAVCRHCKDNKNDMLHSRCDCMKYINAHSQRFMLSKEMYEQKEVKRCWRRGRTGEYVAAAPTRQRMKNAQ